MSIWSTHRRIAFVGYLLLGFAVVSRALTPCPVDDPAHYPAQPMTYSMISDRYGVQYKIGSGVWTDAKAYISYYGGTMASPYMSFSLYPPDTSLSFVSIAVLSASQ